MTAVWGRTSACPPQRKSICPFLLAATFYHVTPRKLKAVFLRPGSWHFAKELSVRNVCFRGHSNNVKALEFGLLAAVWPMWLKTQQEQINRLGAWWWVMKSIKGPASGPWHGRWITFPPDYDPLYPPEAEALRRGTDESVCSPCMRKRSA